MARSSQEVETGRIDPDDPVAKLSLPVCFPGSDSSFRSGGSGSARNLRGGGGVLQIPSNGHLAIQTASTQRVTILLFSQLHLNGAQLGTEAHRSSHCMCPR